MQTLSIPFSSIVEGARARQSTKYGDIGPLKESLKALGTIQPIVLSRRFASNDNLSFDPQDTDEELIRKGQLVFDLIAGGRRYRAMKSMKVETLYHGVTLDPTRLGFVFADEVPEHTRKEAELDENLHRLEMDWIDSALLVADIHESKKRNAQSSGSRWGERQTAALLGKGYGKSNVNYAIRISRVLRGPDGDAKTEMLACASMSDAIALMIKWQEDKALQELQKRNAQRIAAAPVMSGGPGNTSSFLDSLNISQGPKKGGDVLSSAIPAGNTTRVENAPTQSSNVATKVQPSVATEPVEVPLSRMFRCGDCRIPSFQVEVDHIVTDIPYGIDMSNLDEKQVADVKDQHDILQNLEMIPQFLSLAFTRMKPGGFLVFCFDLDHWNMIQKTAKSIGWKVQDWPFIACKTSACQNNAAQFNTTKNYEAIAYMRKDGHTVLRKPIPTSWKAYDFAAERRLYSNPFAKPFELWKDIYDAIAFPGQSVWDPFCGEMSACRAAANCGLNPFGSEIKESHYLRGLEHMKAVYALIHKSNVKFT